MSDNFHTPELLKEYQSYPLDVKVMMTERRIHEFYTGYGSSMGYGNVYVSFSGGKDSTVLLDIARRLYPNIRACFSNTGLEYPEIREFAQRHENVDTVYPKMTFGQVISKYGYPIISKEVSQAIYYARRIPKTKASIWGRNELLGKRGMYSKEKYRPLAQKIPVPISNYCCTETKKKPISRYAKSTRCYPIVATMAEESDRRKGSWMKTGCNSFDGNIMSRPMSFWTEQDVLRYIVQNNLEICSVYGEIVAVDEVGNEYDPRSTLFDGCKLRCTGCQRTGCVWCAFGAHLDGAETRFQRLAKTHPQLYEYCIGGGQLADNPAYDPTAPKFDGEWQNWNPKKIWVPSKKGIGLGEVFRMVNEIYGKDFYRW